MCTLYFERQDLKHEELAFQAPAEVRLFPTTKDTEANFKTRFNELLAFGFVAVDKFNTLFFGDVKPMINIEWSTRILTQNQFYI